MGQEQSSLSTPRSSSKEGKQIAHRRSQSEQHSLEISERPMLTRFYSMTGGRVKQPLASSQGSVEQSTDSLIQHEDQRRQQQQQQPQQQHEQQEEPEEEGIVDVSQQTTTQPTTQNPLLLRLQNIEQPDPFIKDNNKFFFGLENLFDIGTAKMKALSGRESVSRPSSIRTGYTGTSSPKSARSDPLVDMLLTLHSHIDKHMSVINQRQRQLLQRIKHVDDLSQKTRQAIIIAVNQSKVATDRLNEAKYIKKQAKDTRQYATAIFESLARIHQFLNPEDRAGHPEFEKTWPVLHALHQRAKHYTRPALLPTASKQKGAVTTTITIDDLPASLSSEEPLLPPSQSTVPSSSASLSSRPSLGDINSKMIASISTSDSASNVASTADHRSSTMVIDRLRHLMHAVPSNSSGFPISHNDSDITDNDNESTKISQS